MGTAAAGAAGGSVMVRQAVRFAVVGVVNTGSYYAAYLALRLVVPYLVAHMVAFCLSMVGSFFLNCWYTYRTRPTWRKFLLFPLSNLTNFVVTTVGVYVLVGLLTVDERVGPLLAAVVAIPFTFLVSRAILHRPETPAAPYGSGRPVTASAAGRSQED